MCKLCAELWPSYSISIMVQSYVSLQSSGNPRTSADCGVDSSFVEANSSSCASTQQPEGLPPRDARDATGREVNDSARMISSSKQPSIGSKPSIKLIKYCPVASWHWDVGDMGDSCSICHMAFDGCCPDCKFPGDDCPPVWGECGHHFHMHCIVKWLHQLQNAASANQNASSKHCPMCRREWRFKN